MIDKTSPQPLYRQLEEFIRSQIETGELSPGDKLPSEVDLAVAHSISRMTVRRTIDTLVWDGLLHRQPSKGTYVAGPKLSYSASRMMSFVPTLRGLGLPITNKVLDQRVVKAPSFASRDLGLAPEQLVVYVRRLLYVENEPMVLASTYVPYAEFPRLLDADLSQSPLSKVMQELGGLRAAGAQQYLEATVAREEEAVLLNIRAGIPVLLLRRVVTARNGQPIRSDKAIYRSDRLRFAIEATDLADEDSASTEGISTDVRIGWQELVPSDSKGPSKRSQL